MDDDVNLETNIMVPFNLTLPAVPKTQGSPFLSDLAGDVLQIVFEIVLNGAVSILGIITNIINIIVFYRQGIFSGNTNVNLFFLAVSDLGCVITTLWNSIVYCFIIALPHLPRSHFNVVMEIGGIPHAIFVLATKLITAYVTFERCMCVVFPFRVKTWFTARNSLICNLCIFAFFILNHVPFVILYTIEIETQGNTNFTNIQAAFLKNSIVIKDATYFTNFLVMNFASVIVIFLCTLITISYINTSKEWRKSATVSDQGGGKSKDQETKGAKMDKESRLVKMIILISIIFLICYIPEFATSVMKSLDQRIRTDGQFHRLASLMLSVVYFMSALNSSINIFVYYTMSSRYRKEFRMLFGMDDDNKD